MTPSRLGAPPESPALGVLSHQGGLRTELGLDPNAHGLGQEDPAVRSPSQPPSSDGVGEGPAPGRVAHSSSPTTQNGSGGGGGAALKDSHMLTPWPARSERHSAAHARPLCEASGGGARLRGRRAHRAPRLSGEVGAAPHSSCPGHCPHVLILLEVRGLDPCLGTRRHWPEQTPGCTGWQGGGGVC